MTKENRERTALVSAAGLQHFIQPVAVTLTLKKCFKGQHIDRIIASRNLRHFLNRVNRKIFGHAAERYGRTLRVFPVIEISADARLHFHAIVDRPAKVAADQFAAVIQEQWWHTDFGYREIKINEMTDSGWLAYLLKNRQKKNRCLLDAIDWMNCTTIPG